MTIICRCSNAPPWRWQILKERIIDFNLCPITRNESLIDILQGLFNPLHLLVTQFDLDLSVTLILGQACIAGHQGRIPRESYIGRPWTSKV